MAGGHAQQCEHSDSNCAKDSGSEEFDIFKACKLGDLQQCRQFVSTEGVKILNSFDNHGHTPAHWASLGGYNEVIKFLINCGADINKQSKTDYGPFPIHWACVNGHVTTVDLLLQNGVPVDIIDNKGCTPLIIAAQYGKAMLVGYLIGKGSKTFLTDHEGDNALHWACFKGHSELVPLLLYSGFNAKQKDRFGQTPLHLACLSGNLPTVECIVDMDVELDTVDNNGKTPLMLAAGRDHKDVVHFLRKKINRFVKCSLRDIVFGPPGRSRGPVLFFFANLFLWGYPVYFFYVLGETWDSFYKMHSMFLLLNVVMWLSLFFSNKRDPGFLPQHTQEYDMALKQVALFEEWQAKTGINPLENLCHTCRLVRPLRAKHCRICNRCVSHFDHHCPYINNCVGFNNRVPFFLFIASVAGCSFLTLRFAVTMLYLQGFSWIYSIALLQFIIISFVMAALVIFMSYQAAINLTTNERINKRRYKYLHAPTGGFFNPFDRGYIRNWLEFFHWIQPVTKKRDSLMYNV